MTLIDIDLWRHVRYPMMTYRPKHEHFAGAWKPSRSQENQEPYNLGINRAIGYQGLRTSRLHNIKYVFWGWEAEFFSWLDCQSLLEHKETKTQKCSKFSSSAPFYLVNLYWSFKIQHSHHLSWKPYLISPRTTKLGKMPILTSTIIFIPCNYLIICTCLPVDSKFWEGKECVMSYLCVSST